MKKLIAIIILIAATTAWPQIQGNAEVEQQIKEIMKAREEMIKSLLDDSSFDNFDKKFEDMVKNFNHGGFPSIGDQEVGEVVGEYDWRETPTQQIFVLKVKQIKNQPLDIKIEKGQIKLKGDVQSVENKNPKIKTITKVHFERTFSIPEGVDQGNPEFENKAGELLIKFKKLVSSKVPPKIKNLEPIEKPQPVGKAPGDISI